MCDLEWKVSVSRYDKKLWCRFNLCIMSCLLVRICTEMSWKHLNHFAFCLGFVLLSFHNFHPVPSLQVVQCLFVSQYCLVFASKGFQINPVFVLTQYPEHPCIPAACSQGRIFPSLLFQQLCATTERSVKAPAFMPWLDITWSDTYPGVSGHP